MFLPKYLINKKYEQPPTQHSETQKKRNIVYIFINDQNPTLENPQIFFQIQKTAHKFQADFL